MELRDYIGGGTFFLYFFIHFWGTQQIYNSRRFFLIVSALLALWATTFFWLAHRLPYDRLKYVILVPAVHTFFLLVIKLNYHAWHRTLLRKGWIKSNHPIKQFTFVTVSDSGDYWDKKRSARPTYLDRVLSFLLFFGPIGLMILLLDLIAE